ncbi:MAG: ubiquinone/menaquinone biosynthesis methyltransferase [Bacteroidales bacterium]|nr:ubiquinone/menaquinone biosynthesis methyltransferase [Bacteroidales bacterium]
MHNKEFELNTFYTRIYKRYDLINRLFTFGLDTKWRNYAAQECFKVQPENVLDLCCGTGDLIISLCQNLKGSEKITGFDFNLKMLEKARLKLQKKGYNNVIFEHGHAAAMPFETGAFDAVTIGFGFRNLTFNNPDAQKHLNELARVIKQGGFLFILESGVPQNRAIQFFYRLYLYMVLIPLGGLISGNVRAYWYLAHSSSKFYSTDKIERMLAEKGFKCTKSGSFFFGACNLLSFQKL